MLEKGLGGVMFWEYHADRTGALLDTLDATLRRDGRGAALRGLALRARPRRRGARRLLGEPDSRPIGSSSPASCQAQGFGDDVTVDTKWTGQIVDRSFFTSPRYEPYREPGRVKVPFWLQPDKHYVGPAWYERDVEIPPEWKGRRLVLHLERPHWQTIAWLDGKVLGSNDSLSTPHEYDLGTAIEPGTHRLTIRVDNRLVVDVGLNSHSVSDHTQGNWNGIVGRPRAACRQPGVDRGPAGLPARRLAVGASCAGGSASGGPAGADPSVDGGRPRPRRPVGPSGTAGPSRRATSDVSWERRAASSRWRLPLGAGGAVVGRVLARAPAA